MISVVSFALDQSNLPAAPSSWSVKHLNEGKTRLEVLHGDKTHYYEVQLTGINIDGEPIELNEPKIKHLNNLTTIEWLPFLKEIWIDANGYSKWSFEVDRPNFLSNSAKQIALTFDVNSDGIGGLDVGDTTTIVFDEDIYGEPIEGSNAHAFKREETVSLGIQGSRCHKAIDIVSYPAKPQSLVFKLESSSFPLYSQTNFDRKLPNKSNIGIQSSDWFLSKFSANNDLIRLVVPVDKMFNNQLVDTIKIYQKQTLINNAMFEQVNEKNLTDYITIAHKWYPIVADKVNQNKWQSKKNAKADFLKDIKQTLMNIDDLAEDYFFGKPIVLAEDYLYAVSNGADVSRINILKSKGNEWIEQNPIEIKNQKIDADTLPVDRQIASVVVDNNLMVVAMEVTSWSVPHDYKDKHSAGEVRVYRKLRNRWILEEILVPEIGDLEDGFGEVIAVGENTVVVAANNFKPDNRESLYGLVHVFNYRAGQWQDPIVIKPPVQAKNDGHFQNQGFGSQLQLVGDDLYIKAINQGYSSNQTKLSETPVDCPYFDSFGVIYHYRKIGHRWTLLHEIKSHNTASILTGPMMADSTGLYFLSLDSNAKELPHIYIKHYSDGQINWQQALPN